MSINISSAYIEITNMCNLNCITCYNRSGLNNSRQELSAAQLELIIKQLSILGCKRINFAGGEPCLHREFDNILSFTTTFPNIDFSIVTNGTIFDKLLVDTYKQINNLFIQISLDGSCEEFNSKTRGANNFAKSTKLIDALLECKKKLAIKMVISQCNIIDVEAFYRFVVEKGAIPDFAFINQYGNGAEDWEYKKITSKQKLSVLNLIDNLNIEYDIKANLPLCTSNCPLDDLNAPMSVAIKVDGTLIPCQILYNDKFTICNILDYTQDELERSFKRIAAMVAMRKETDYGCTKCIMRNQCKKGCMALADYYSSDPFGIDGECQFRKLQLVGYDLRNQIFKETINV